MIAMFTVCFPIIFYKQSKNTTDPESKVFSILTFNQTLLKVDSVRKNKITKTFAVAASFLAVIGLAMATMLWYLYLEEYVEGINRLIELSQQLSVIRTQLGILFKTKSHQKRKAKPLGTFCNDYITSVTYWVDYFSGYKVQRVDTVGILSFCMINIMYLGCWVVPFFQVFLNVDPPLHFLLMLTSKFPVFHHFLSNLTGHVGFILFLIRGIFTLSRFLFVFICTFEFVRLFVIGTFLCLSGLELCNRNVVLVEKICQFIINSGKQQTLKHIRVYRQLSLCVSLVKETFGIAITLYVSVFSIFLILLNYSIVRYASGLPLPLLGGMIYRAGIAFGLINFLLSLSIRFNEGMERGRRIIFCGTGAVGLEEAQRKFLRREVEGLFPALLNLRLPGTNLESMTKSTKIGIIKLILDSTLNALLTF